MRDWPETENEWALTWAIMTCRDRIAELETENERLKVCGTCWYYRDYTYDGPVCRLDGIGKCDLPCSLTPPRWTPYWEAEHDT